MDGARTLEEASCPPELWRTAGAEPAARSVTAGPRHAGHRDRLRERASAGGLGALPDYELLELLLFRSFPRGDVKPIAKALLARFGSLQACLLYTSPSPRDS